jgi:hypothetical protein
MNFYQVSLMSRDVHTKCNKGVTIFRSDWWSHDFTVTSSSQCWWDAKVVCWHGLVVLLHQCVDELGNEDFNWWNLQLWDLVIVGQWWSNYVRLNRIMVRLSAIFIGNDWLILEWVREGQMMFVTCDVFMWPLVCVRPSAIKCENTQLAS